MKKLLICTLSILMVKVYTQEALLSSPPQRQSIVSRWLANFQNSELVGRALTFQYIGGATQATATISTSAILSSSGVGAVGTCLISWPVGLVCAFPCLATSYILVNELQQRSNGNFILSPTIMTRHTTPNED